MSNFNKINSKLKDINCKIYLLSEEKDENCFHLIFSSGYKIDENRRNRNISRMILYSSSFEYFAEELLSADLAIRQLALAKRKTFNSRKGGIATMAKPQNHIRNKVSNDFTSWNDGLTGLIGWSKGLSKNTDARILNISKAKMGEKNPMFGKQLSDEHKRKISTNVKARILSGEWTPNAHNSRTRKNILFRGIKFRSSWEVIFYAATGHAYEKIRIPYTSEDGIFRIYITDFFEKATNTIFEIKPKSELKKHEHKHLLLLLKFRLILSAHLQD